MWPEVEKALKEKRHELKLLPENVNKDNNVDENLFLCEDLNLLQISETRLVELPAKVAGLTNLQNLLLFRNKIAHFPSGMANLSKLKVLDLSGNCIASIPDEINDLVQLTTLNLSGNSIEAFPTVSKLNKLAVLNLSGNKLKAVPDFAKDSFLLSDLILNDNAIEVVPENLEQIASTLKVLNLEQNSIKQVPKLLARMPKMKDLHLKGNPVADKRLLKLINQCGTKQILDYVKQHGSSAAPTQAVPSKGASSKSTEKESTVPEPTIKSPKVFIEKFNDDKSLRIVSTEAVRAIRPHIVCSVLKDIVFTAATFKSFIQLQTKLHDTVCQKRELCTIATHDYDKIVKSEDRAITYTADLGNKIPIVPLGRMNSITALKYYEELKSEAEALRKEKKRNTYSGIHKYLHLLDKSESFAFLKDSAGTTISLPPLTNSDNTAISVETKNILVEITSSSSTIQGCKKAFDMLVSEMINKQIGFNNDTARLGLVLEQVRVLDEEGSLRMVYPSKVDLQLESIEVQRE